MIRYKFVVTISPSTNEPNGVSILDGFDHTVSMLKLITIIVHIEVL